jgi:signal transduction histidine kinase
MEIRHRRDAPRIADIEIVVDDEAGIPHEELARVLQPFYRLDESRSLETGGVGLGLAIAQSIVQAHGGSLALNNRPEGGLRVTIRLPLSRGLRSS